MLNFVLILYTEFNFNLNKFNLPNQYTNDYQLYSTRMLFYSISLGLGNIDILCSPNMNICFCCSQAWLDYNWTIFVSWFVLNYTYGLLEEDSMAYSGCRQSSWFWSIKGSIPGLLSLNMYTASSNNLFANY